MRDAFPYSNRTLGPCFNSVVIGFLPPVIITVKAQCSAMRWVIIHLPTGVNHLDMQLYSITSNIQCVSMWKRIGNVLQR